MSVPTVPVPNAPTTNGAELTEPPFSPALVEELVRKVAKALRTRTLYLPNNPIYHAASDGLREAFAAIWSESDQVTLSVTEGDIRWEGRVVANEPSRQEGLPWLLYKDGVRELTFMQGFEADELEQLLDILVRARKAAPEEDDLLTLLWEREFLYLRYRFVDLSLDSAGIETPVHLSEETRNVGAPEAMVEESPRPGIVSMEDLDSSLYFLEEHEIDYLRSEVASEYRQGQHRHAIGALIDIFEAESAADIRTEVAKILDGLVPQLLSSGEYGAVAYLLKEARELVSRLSDVAAEARSVLEKLPERLGGSNVLPQLIRSLDESQAIPPQEDLDALFAELRGNTLALVLSAIPKTHTPRLRSALETAGARLAAVNTAELVRLILSPDAAVAIQAVRRAGELATPAAVAPLGKLLVEGALEVRQAAALALANIGSPGALRVIEQALDDEDREVRITAVRAIGTRQFRAALPQVANAIRGRVVRDGDLTERMAWFETFGALAGEEGTELLSGLLTPGGFFARKVDAEVRACAAMALGRIGTPRALEALRGAVNDKDVLVRSSVNKALRGGTG